MSANVFMGVEEYLRTSFEGDREYLDGEVVERNCGEWEHSTVMVELIWRLHPFAERSGIQILPVIRIQIHPRRFRVADIAVWKPGLRLKGIPAVAPFLAIEILSPEDRLTRMQPKIQEYLAIGAEYVWVIDPYERKAMVYTPRDAGGRLVDVLRTENPGIEIPLSSVLPESA